MGTNVEITNVNKEANFVSFNENGQSVVKEVVLPAQIKWAKIGKAEIGYNPEGKINFIKSLEPRAAPTGNFGGRFNKPESNIRAISTMEIQKGVTLEAVQTKYNEVNAREKAKCAASTLFQKGDMYDAVFYVTTFVPKDNAVQPTPAPTPMPASNAEMMGSGDGSM